MTLGQKKSKSWTDLTELADAAGSGGFLHPTALVREATPEAWVSQQARRLRDARNGWANPRRSWWALVVGVVVAGVLVWHRLQASPPATSTVISPTATRPMPFFYRVGVSTEEEAQAKWAKTLEWRREQGMDQILTAAPPQDFTWIMEHFPTGFMHLPDREGNNVVIDQYGKVHLAALTSHGITHDALLRHYMFQLEYLWSVASPRETDLITLIMDIKNVTFDQITPETVALVKARVRIGCEHYPNRAARIVVTNTPATLMTAFRLVSPMLSEATKSKMIFLSADDLARGGLREFVAPEHLPVEYGGTSDVPLGQSPLELQLKQHVKELTAVQARRRRSGGGGSGWWGLGGGSSGRESDNDQPRGAKPGPPVLPPDQPNARLDAIFDAWENAIAHVRSAMEEVGGAWAALNDQFGELVGEFAHCETDSPCVQLSQ